MPPRPPPPPPKANATNDAADGDDSAGDDHDAAPDNKAQESRQEVQVVRVQSASEQARQQQEEEANKEPCCKCCTCRCCCKWGMRPIGYFFLAIAVLVGLILALVFGILHGVLRLIHILMYGIGLLRSVLDEHLDVDAVVKKHDDDVKLDKAAYDRRMETKKREADAKLQRQKLDEASGKRRPASKDDSESESDNEWEEPKLRLCSFGCGVGGSLYMLGGIFNMIASLMLVLSFCSGMAALGLFTAIVPSCSLRAAQYLSGFRMAYDVEFAQKHARSEPSS